MSDTTEVHFRYAGEVRLDFPELDLAVILKGRLQVEPGLRLPVCAHMLRGDIRYLMKGLLKTNADLVKIAGLLQEASSKAGSVSIRVLPGAEEVKPTTPSGNGYKQDTGKLDYNLLMRDLAPQVEQIVKVLHWGHHTKGYPRNGFRTLPDAEGRFMAATQRHLAAMAKDALAKDSESGLPHAIHVIANQLMMLAALEEQQ